MPIYRVQQATWRPNKNKNTVEGTAPAQKKAEVQVSDAPKTMVVPKKIEEKELAITQQYGVFRSTSGCFSAARTIYKAQGENILNEVDEVQQMQLEERALTKKRMESRRMSVRQQSQRQLRGQLDDEIEARLAEKSSGDSGSKVDLREGFQADAAGMDGLLEMVENDPAEASAVQPEEEAEATAEETASKITDSGDEYVDTAQLEQGDCEKEKRKKKFQKDFEEYVRNQPEKIDWYRPPTPPKAGEQRPAEVGFRALDQADSSKLDLSNVVKRGDFGAIEYLESDEPEVEKEKIWRGVDGVNGAEALQLFRSVGPLSGRTPQRPAKVLVVFYSLFGQIDGLVKEFIAGVRKVKFCSVDVLQVPETLRQSELGAMNAPQKSFYPVFDHVNDIDKLREADALLFAFPETGDGLPMQIRLFFDSLFVYTRDNAFLGKLAATFCIPTDKTPYSGDVLVDAAATYAHCGMVNVPLPGQESQKARTADNRWTAAKDATSICENREVRHTDIELARKHGEYFASLARKYAP
mmetsp:Transcript_516/g.1766  ORF Transcript_516/g.1766 Transcript_516/m.1766 type:complete len:524 (-) Transcript_516:140-1711(-)